MLSKSLKPLKVGEGKGYDSNYSLRAISELPSSDATVVAPSDSEGCLAFTSDGLSFTSDPLGCGWLADLDSEELEDSPLSELLSDSFHDCLMSHIGMEDEVIGGCDLREGSVHIKVISEERLVVAIPCVGDLDMSSREFTVESLIESLEAFECVADDGW